MTATAPTPLMHASAPVAGASLRGAATARTGVEEKACDPERVRTRAYEIFQLRVKSGTMGDAQADWLQAETELNGGSGSSFAAAKSECGDRPAGKL